jgi:hypothetical protein
MLKYDMVLLCLSGYDFSNVAFARSNDNIVKAGDKGVPGTMGTAAEWKGKKILTSVGTVVHADMMLTLNVLGLKDTDVDIVSMDTPIGLQAFLAGEGDILYTCSSWASEMQKQPGYTQIHSMEKMGNGMAGNIIVSRDYLAKHEDEIVKYLQGSIEIIQWLRDPANMDQAADWFTTVIRDEFGINMTYEDAVTNIQQVGFRDLAFYEDLCKTGSDGLTGLQREFKKFFEYLVIMGSQDPKNLDTVLSSIDAKYLAKALENYKKDKGL